MAQNQPIRRNPQNAEIPDKLYFRIGDVAKLCAVPAYVLRFWEAEFPQLKPNKGGTGQRLYRRRDVEMALRIKRLLYDEGYTIPGARQVLKGEQRGNPPQLALAIESGSAAAGPAAAGAGLSSSKRLERLRKDMEDLLGMLAKPVATAPPPAPVHTIRTLRASRVPGLSLTPPSEKIGLFDLYPGPDSTDDPAKD